jgi:hypothetical protein
MENHAMKLERSRNRQPTVRVNAQAKEKLDRMQAQTDLSQPALLDQAIELLERKLMAEQMRADFEAIADDPETLATYQAVTGSFDGAVGDGLKRE